MRKLTMIKRTTPACPACLGMQAILDGEGIEYDVIDLTEQPEAVEKYDITSVPTLLLDGEVTFTGITPAEVIQEAMLSESK